MEPSNTARIWILWVDNENWGYATSADDARFFLDKISNEIQSALQLEHPKWTVECLIKDEQVKIKCTDPGWTWNSTWTKHTVRYEPVHRLVRERATIQQDSSIPSAPPAPPVFKSKPKRRNRRNRRSK